MDAKNILVLKTISNMKFKMKWLSFIVLHLFI